METSPTSSHVDPVPPPTGLAAVWKHLTDWATIYFWLPMSLLSIWLFSKVAYLLTGRRPQENADWIVGFSFSLVKAVFVVFFVEVTIQQTGKWWTKDDLREYPHLALTQSLTNCVTLLAFVWLLSR